MCLKKKNENTQQPKQLKRKLFESKKSYEKRQQEEKEKYIKSKSEIKKARAKKRLKRFAAVILALVIIIGGLNLASYIGNVNSIKGSLAYIKTLPTVQVSERIVPQRDAEGNFTFVTDKDFKIMQLTDVHFGGGWNSAEEDKKAISAIAAMVLYEKPDLIIVTGDLVFPVPIISGTINNLACHKAFAALMDKLGIYWTVIFGNHDSESYNIYSRSDVGEFYQSLTESGNSFCLFNRGPADIDGEGNQVIKIKNTKGEIVKALIMLDTHDYVDDFLGLSGKYDNMHPNQIAWYEQTLNKLKVENDGIMPKSLAFYHIPTEETQKAWDEYVSAGRVDTINLKYIRGVAGEAKAGSPAGTKIAYGPFYETDFYETMLRLKSTEAVFNGHDHLNNFIVEYLGIKIVYGYSIDYLAYSGIDNYGNQRGCVMITLKPNGQTHIEHKNYYEIAQYTLDIEGYKKEDVSMEDYYS